MCENRTNEPFRDSKRMQVAKRSRLSVWDWHDKTTEAARTCQTSWDKLQSSTWTSSTAAPRSVGWWLPHESPGEGWKFHFQAWGLHPGTDQRKACFLGSHHQCYRWGWKTGTKIIQNLYLTQTPSRGETSCQVYELERYLYVMPVLNAQFWTACLQCFPSIWCFRDGDWPIIFCRVLLKFVYIV